MTESDIPGGAAPPSPPHPYETLQADRDALAARLRETNKAALFDALAIAGIAHVVVSFDGYGDSGQIESVEAKAVGEIVPLPTTAIAIGVAVWGQAEPETRSMTLDEAVEHLAYDFLEETHSGWEDGDGAYGDFTFDVAKRSIMLDYNDRYTASENHQHEF